jgi:AraC-like DNA-binding protein
MDREKIVKRYFSAWNERDVPKFLRLMHPQASFYDAFWQETCTGQHLSKYFYTNLEIETCWYEPDDEIVATPNGMVARYVAYDVDDPEGCLPIYNGAEVITLSDGLILTISDYYCDPNPTDLIDLAKVADAHHRGVDSVSRGLSAKASSRISRRLAALVGEAIFFLDPDLTMTKLAEQVGCSVMHLFHVLEDQKGTTFLDYVNECRCRYASSLLVDPTMRDIRFDEIAEQSGFDSIRNFREAFQSTFGISAVEYLAKFAAKPDESMSYVASNVTT